MYINPHTSKGLEYINLLYPIRILNYGFSVFPITCQIDINVTLTHFFNSWHVKERVVPIVETQSNVSENFCFNW